MNLIMEKRNIRIMKEYNPFFYNLMRAGVIDRMTAIKAEKYVTLENVPYVMAKKINLITDMEIIKMINADGGKSSTFFFVKRGDDKTLNNLYTPEVINTEESVEETETPIQVEEIKEEISIPIPEEKIEESISSDIQDSTPLEESKEEEIQEDSIEEVKEEPIVEESESINIEESTKPLMTSGYIQVVGEENSAEIESVTTAIYPEDSEPLVISAEDRSIVEEPETEPITIATSTITEPIRITAPTNFKNYNGKNKKKKKH